MKKLTIFLLLIISFSLIAQKKEAHEKWVDSLLKKNQKDFVEKLLKEKLKNNKTKDYANRCLGYLYYTEKNLNLSEKFYKAELISKPKCASCNLYLARVYTRKKDLKKALIYLDKTIILERKNDNFYGIRARFKNINNDIIGASNDIKKAIELNSNNSELFSIRSRIYIQDNLLTLGLIDCNKAISLEPKNWEYYLQRFEIYFKQQKLNEALIDIEKGISIDENQSELYNARSVIYATQGEFSKANADLEKAIELNSSDFMAFFLRSKIRYKAEDMNGSCEDLSKSLELLNLNDSENNLKSEIENSIKDYCNDSKPSYFFQRGIAYYNMLDFEKSIAIYSKGLEKFPNNSMSHSFRGNSYFEAKQYEKAIKDFEISNQNIDNLIIDMRENPQYEDMPKEKFDDYVLATIATNHLVSAQCKFALEKFDDALFEIDKAIDMAPNIAGFGLENYYNLRGMILMALGENEKAIVDFNKSLERNQSLALVLINRAIAKMNLKSRIKSRSSSISGRNSNTGFFARYDLPIQSKIEYSNPNLQEALQDCDLAIREDSKIGYAYYVRGAIKKLLENESYCNDFKKAKSLDYQFDESILVNCR